MKFSLATVLACGLAAEAHSIFQKVSVNGKDQGQLTGIRAPNNNNPVQDVNSNNMICGQPGSKSNTVIKVAGGDRIGAYWGHIIGGQQFPNDADHPIAKSHKGPVMAYLAKVDNAATASLNGLRWFKIWQDTFDTGSKTWGVDNLIKNQGWVYFNIPTCLAGGDYLLRVETLALHSANKPNQAQFYQSCAQISLTSSGTKVVTDTVSIPGAYTQQHPGISTNIYGLAGQPDNAGRPYQAPGPAPITC
jgi:cellulase